MLSYDTPKEALRGYLKQKRSQEEYLDIIDAMDDRYKRDLTLHPTDGSIVAREGGNVPVLGYTFGLSYRGMFYYAGNTGLEFQDVLAKDLFWRVE